jgi:hypothetical protein
VKLTFRKPQVIVDFDNACFYKSQLIRLFLPSMIEGIAQLEVL